MPLSLRRGTVTAISERHEGLVRAEVDGAPCVAYPRLTGPVALGDEVLVNTQARELALGSGGFDVLYANLTRGLGLAAEEGAHVMKLPYTPGQFAARHAEEDGELAESLDGMPVVCCSLHSQVVPVCAALAGLRVAYVQLPGGALPVAALRRRARARSAGSRGVAVGACFDGDVAVRLDRVGARRGRRRRASTSPCARSGPGSSGPAPRLGHGGLAAAEAANAASALGGRPVVVRAGLGGGRARAPPRRSPTTRRPCSSSASATSSSARTETGWREACARAAALPHGSRPGRRPCVLRSRVRGGQARARAARDCPNSGQSRSAPSTTGSSSTSPSRTGTGASARSSSIPGAVCIVAVDRGRLRHARPPAARGDRRRAARDPGGHARARRGAARDRAAASSRRRPA